MPMPTPTPISLPPSLSHLAYALNPAAGVRHKILETRGTDRPRQPNRYDGARAYLPASLPAYLHIRQA
jgi:hypothetical protein